MRHAFMPGPVLGRRGIDRHAAHRVLHQSRSGGVRTVGMSIMIGVILHLMTMPVPRRSSKGFYRRGCGNHVLVSAAAYLIDALWRIGDFGA